MAISVPRASRDAILLLAGLCASIAVLLATTLPRAATARALPALEGAEPTFDAGEHVMLWSDQFDVAPPPSGSGRSHAQGRYGRYVTRDARQLHFDVAAGIGGSGALRLDWAAADPATRCADDSRVLEATFPAARELYIQYSVRYTPGFVFDWRGRQPCVGNAKKLFLLWAREGSRFVFISENGSLGVGSDHDHPLLPQRSTARVTPADLADGQWHRITLHVRQGTTPTSPDGSVHGWIDGVMRWAHDGIVTHNAGGYYLFKMPATFNAGSPVAQSEWLDDLRIWRMP